MNIYESQIRERENYDRQYTERAFDELAASVSSGGNAWEFISDAAEGTDGAAVACLKYLKVQPGWVPDSVSDPEERIDWLCRPSGTMYRKVTLTGKWYRSACGAMMGVLSDGEATALLPRRTGGYSYIDPRSGIPVRIRKKNAEMIRPEGILFYKPLPAGSIGKAELFTYIRQLILGTDILRLFLYVLAITLLGLLPAMMNHMIFSGVIPGGQTGVMIPIGLFLLGAGVSTVILGASKTLFVSRMGQKVTMMSQAAFYSRILSMPGTFFKAYEPGDLANRVRSMSEILMMGITAALESGASVILSVIFVIQIYHYAPKLALPALLIAVVQIALIAIVTKMGAGYRLRAMDAAMRLSGTEEALLAGQQKIKLAGAEDRAFAKWAHRYSEYARFTYNVPLIIRSIPVCIMLLGMLGNIWIYFRAGMDEGLTVSGYMAFSVAFGQITGVIGMVGTVSVQIARIKALYPLMRPILEAEPEIRAESMGVEKLSGRIEVADASFRYHPNAPYIFEHLSFTVKPGEYVGIVGRSGCGKTTVLQLLLGMEKPERGTVFYDNYDVSTVDTKSLRRQLGVVTQDGKLFAGDIFNNITIASPKAGMEDAWEAAEIAGIADDIRKMPMGMQTIISEGSGGISGGQRQRLLIARAVCQKKKILLFDEATSALDNVTQKHVSDQLSKLSCTRIVIAHRLSTVKNCDRILVLDHGGIAEQGSYEELMQRKGLFYELVKRQQL